MNDQDRKLVTTISDDMKAMFERLEADGHSPPTILSYAFAGAVGFIINTTAAPIDKERESMVNLINSICDAKLREKEADK